MAYDLEEQESLAEIKAWWDKWGTLILSVVTAACLAASAYQGWRWYQAKESAEAGTLYAQMVQASNAKDYSRAVAIGDRLSSEYASTAYAGIGALLAARSAESEGKSEEAVKALTRITGSDKYPELKTIAAVRLAGIYLDEGKFDDALNALKAIPVEKNDIALIEDRRGDILLAKGEVAAAKTSWETALKNCPVTSPIAGVLTTKLESLNKTQE